MNKTNIANEHPVELYQDGSGNVALEVHVLNDTAWLSQGQLSDLFGKNKRTISEHISNLFKEEELIENDSVVRKFRTTASDGKSYEITHYSLDVIISVGYRVKSKEGVAFRRWANNVLKDHLIKGYTINQKRLAQKGMQELENAMQLMAKTLEQQSLISDLGSDVISIIVSYSKTWQLLLAYDEEKLELPSSQTQSDKPGIQYAHALEAIAKLKTDLMLRHQASELFGNEKQHELAGILGNIEQTFAGELLYKTAEERAAHLLYFVIKDHPFSDGNKRIGSFLFLLYARQQGLSPRINDNALVALALLVAESEPKQKDLLVKLIVNLLVNGHG